MASFCTNKTHLKAENKLLLHVACLRTPVPFLFIFIYSHPSVIVSVNFSAFGKNHCEHGSQFKSSQFGGFFFCVLFFFSSSFVAWETGNVMGRTWGLLWGQPLLARWKAHSSHFSYWIVLRLLLNVAFSLQPCARQSLGMKLLSTILPSPDERY